MKIKPKQYAISLFESIDKKGGKEIENILKRFVDVLAANNDISKLEKIVNCFSEIWDKNNGIIRAEVKSAHPLDDSVLKNIKKYIKERADAKEIIVREEEDKNLLGGVVIKYGSRIIDGSIRTRLDDLGRKMNK